MRIEFRILGPLELSTDGRVLPLGSPKQRALLALLLIHANETVSRDRLIEELWGDAAPATVESAFHSYLSRLRRLLDSAGGGGLLVREAHGYRLRVEGDQLDADRFERLVSAGSEALAAGKVEVAADRLRQALALWRGPALADVQSERFAITAAARLEEARVSALEQRLEADLALGRHGRLIGELETLVAEHPYRERLRAHLMLTLYRSGRQAEALRAYQEARRTLADELGLEPSQELKELEQAILRQDPTLKLARADPATELEPRLPPPAAVAPPREERKVVSVLFADLVAFTEQAELLDPEDVRAIQDRYWAPVRAEIERHGGTVEKFVGDAVMALFGAPQTHEDDAERAVRAALAIREWAREEGLEVRIAVTTGEALVRLGAQPLAGEGMAAGDVVNTCARLQAAAPVNGILVGERTFSATRQVIDYGERGPVEAKGRSEAILVWEALQARSRFGVDLFRKARTPLVGRGREVDVLTDALARVQVERASQLVTLVGVPGIGKSRLVYELMETIADDPNALITWRQGRSLPYGDGVSFWALGEIVKAQAGILETDSEPEAEAKLAQVVRTLLHDVADAEWVERHLRPLVGLAGESEAGEGRAEAFAAWRRFFEALTERRTAVVVFEDLHWADEGLLDFVDSLVDWVVGVPLLVLVTARPELLERRRDWGGGKLNATTLSLSPLSDGETGELLRGLLQQSQLPSETERALLTRAAGNPLYAEQYAQMWEERAGEDLPLPETVQGIIAARLDTLAPAEKMLLQNAAVFGKVFWQGAVLALDGAESTSVRACLHALERKGFVQRAQRSSVAGEDEYSFRHVLVSDVAYAQIPRGTRVGHHQRAAAWIESLGRAEDHAELIAYHYAAALELALVAGRAPGELRERALSAYGAAGERAFAASAYIASGRYYRQALDLVPAGDPVRAELLLGYGRAARIAERAGADELLEARDAFASRGDNARAAQAQAALLELACDRHDFDDAMRWLEEAERLARALEGDSSKAYLLTSISRANMLFGSNDARAIAAGREALTIAGRLGLPELQVHALNNIGVTRVETCDFGGIADLERAIELAEPLKSLELLRAYNNIGLALYASGTPFSEYRTEVKALRAAERLGIPHWIAHFRAHLAIVLLDTGEDWDEAMRLATAAAAESHARLVTTTVARHVRRSIHLARDEIEQALADSYANADIARRDVAERWQELASHAHVLFATGRVDEAARVGEEIEPRHIAFNVLDTGGPPSRIEALVQLGRTEEYLAALDNLPVATPWTGAARHWLTRNFEAAASIYESIGFRTAEAYARLRAGEQLRDKGDRAEANEQLEQALAFYRSVGATRYIREAEALLAASGSERETATPQPRT